MCYSIYATKPDPLCRGHTEVTQSWGSLGLWRYRPGGQIRPINLVRDSYNSSYYKLIYDSYNSFNYLIINTEMNSSSCCFLGRGGFPSHFQSQIKWFNQKFQEFKNLHSDEFKAILFLILKRVTDSNLSEQWKQCNKRIRNKVVEQQNCCWFANLNAYKLNTHKRQLQLNLPIYENNFPQ